MLVPRDATSRQPNDIQRPALCLFVIQGGGLLYLPLKDGPPTKECFNVWINFAACVRPCGPLLHITGVFTHRHDYLVSVPFWLPALTRITLSLTPCVERMAASLNGLAHLDSSSDTSVPFPFFFLTEVQLLSLTVFPFNIPKKYSSYPSACYVWSIMHTHSDARTDTHPHTHTQFKTCLTWFLLMHFLLFSFISLSLIMSGICCTMKVYFIQNLNALSSFLPYQWEHALLMHKGFICVIFL